MTIDERIGHLTDGLASLKESQEKTQVMLADIVDTIRRLERIALSHEMRIQDTEDVLRRLEGRERPKQ